MSNTPDIPDTTPDEVREFLSQQPVQLDLQADDVPLVQQVQPEPSEPYTAPRRSELDPDAPTEQREMQWNIDVGPDLKIEVSQLERDLFWKAALTDHPVKFDVAVRSIAVQCQTANEYEMDVMFAALDRDEREMLVLTDGQFRSQLQDYGMFVQILRVDGQPFDYHIDLNQFETFELAVQGLREHHQLVRRTFNEARRAILLHAFRIFTAKIQTCTTNLHNEDFWTPPVTG